MSFLVWCAAVLVVIAWVISIVDIVRRRTDLPHMAGWILLVVLLPIAGSIIYWVTRKSTTADVAKTASAQADLRRNAPGGRF